MKWLTLDYIKQHSRIDFQDDDSLLELYADSAEETILNIINTTYDELLEKFGTDVTTTDDEGTETTTKKLPSNLYHAALLLVDLSYQQRSPVSPSNLYVVPYAFDILVKPYMVNL